MMQNREDVSRDPRIITVIGSLNKDLVTVTPRVPSGGETLTASSFHIGSGGKGANQAVACTRLSRPSGLEDIHHSDIQVAMIGAVGDDEFGKPLINALKTDGIDTRGIREVNNMSTGVAVIIVEEGTGENRIMLNPGANHWLQPEYFTSQTAVEQFGTPKPALIVLQLEIPIKTVLTVIEIAKNLSIPVLLNPAPAVELPTAIFKGLDHLIVNESEAALLSGRRTVDVERDDMDWGTVTDEFLERGVKNVVVTLGAKGAYFSNTVGRGSMVPPFPGIKVVDTTAAGDTFVGAYAVDAVRGVGKLWDQESAVKWACKAAGKTCEKRGAQSAIPWADEV